MLTECQILARNEVYTEKNMENGTQKSNTVIGRVTMKTKKNAIPTVMWETGKGTGKILWHGCFYAPQFSTLEIL